MRVQRNIKSVQLTRHLFFCLFSTQYVGGMLVIAGSESLTISPLVPPPTPPGSGEFRPVAGALLRAHILISSLHTAWEDLTSHVKLGSNPLLSWCVHIYIYIKYWLIVIYTTQSS